MDQLNEWFTDHLWLFFLTGLSIVVVQLCVLISSIFLCIKRVTRKPPVEPHNFPESSPQTRDPLDIGTMKNDQMYPTKRGESPITMPLALIHDDIVKTNSFKQPKFYNNNHKRIDENFQRNEFLKTFDGKYSGSYNGT